MTDMHNAICLPQLASAEAEAELSRVPNAEGAHGECLGISGC